MTSRQDLFSYTADGDTKTAKYKRAKKEQEAVRTLQEVGEIVGMSAASVGGVETRALKKLVYGFRQRGFSYYESILAVQSLIGVKDPRVILRVLPDEFTEIAGQELKNQNIS